ncbi:hypothetical protein JR316_0000522 [Psilocybe cubensis]|nr:hypothetical protein JR316_0000522 [Psilocybe cubensis]KAH9486457.1 hypothetical protein JR316_0000522 [Psilocybe cubensis]
MGRRRGRRLAALPGMPLDILFEIFGHLHPYDLLKLSRMSKDFRRLLLSKSSVSVWKDSLANVPGLPESFPGMTEVEWANLAFSPHCHVCLAPNIRAVEWRFKIRICSKCAKDHFREFSRMPMLDRTFRTLLGDVIPTRRAKRGHAVCLASDFDAVMSEYKEIQDDESRTQYIRGKNATLDKFLKHAQRCEHWEGTQSRDRCEELEQLRKERLAAIERKLIELGWEQDVRGIKYPDSLARHKLVHRPQLLTERIWTNIKPGIIEFMEEMKEKRLRREIESIHAARRKISLDAVRTFKKSKMKDNILIPTSLELWRYQPIEEIINAPRDKNITVSSFDEVMLDFPKFVNEWRQSIAQRVTSIIKNIQGEVREDFCYDDFSEQTSNKTNKLFPNANLSEDQLLAKMSLASTVFRCNRCNRPNSWDDCAWDLDDNWVTLSNPLFYPHVLGHHCLYDDDDIYIYDQPRGQLWSSTSLAYDALSSKHAEKLVESIGGDPAVTTTDDMDGLNLRFLCRLCPKSKEKEHEEPVLPLFDWRAAIQHMTDYHYSKFSFTIVKQVNLDHEIIEAEADYRDKDPIWRCIHCYGTNQDPQSPMTVENVARHFSYVHRDILSPIRHVDYYEDFASPNLHTNHYRHHILYVRCLKSGQYKLATEFMELSNPGVIGHVNYGFDIY